MANKNAALGTAKANKKDEFYTQLSDIEKELRHYKQHFRGKTVLCNCDDPFESNFFKYFVLNFNRLGLKKLIATSYAASPITGTQLRYHVDKDNQLYFMFDDDGQVDRTNRPYKAIVTQVYDKNGDGSVGMIDVAELFRSGENELKPLFGDGDFRSPECLALLDEADIVVTNPPFSLFREYVSALIEHKKKFVIIGNLNAVKYKEIFPLIKDNKIWMGASIHSGDRAFYVPDDYPLNAAGCGIDESGRKFIRVKGIRWFTNLDIKQRHESLILVKRYDPDIYPSYMNFDGIDVASVSDIPCDFAGIMGVPINIVDSFNPDQFELIGTSTGALGKSVGVTPNYRGRTDVAYIDSNGQPHCPYQRFFVRNKRPEPPKGAPQ